MYASGGKSTWLYSSRDFQINGGGTFRDTQAARNHLHVRGTCNASNCVHATVHLNTMYNMHVYEDNPLYIYTHMYTYKHT